LSPFTSNSKMDRAHSNQAQETSVQCEEVTTNKPMDREGNMSDNPAFMIRLCQEGKSSPGALRRSANGNSFLVLRRVCWPLQEGA
jgi:hypothetical protein